MAEDTNISVPFQLGIPRLVDVQGVDDGPLGRRLRPPPLVQQRGCTKFILPGIATRTSFWRKVLGQFQIRVPIAVARHLYARRNRKLMPEPWFCQQFGRDGDILLFTLQVACPPVHELVRVLDVPRHSKRPNEVNVCIATLPFPLTYRRPIWTSSDSERAFVKECWQLSEIPGASLMHARLAPVLA